MGSSPSDPYLHFLEDDESRVCEREGCDQPRYSTHPNTKYCLEHKSDRHSAQARARRLIVRRKRYKTLRLKGATVEQACAGSMGQSSFDIVLAHIKKENGA